jgi:hypothetical protein
VDISAAIGSHDDHSVVEIEIGQGGTPASFSARARRGETNNDAPSSTPPTLPSAPNVTIAFSLKALNSPGARPDG